MVNIDNADIDGSKIFSTLNSDDSTFPWSFTIVVLLATTDVDKRG